MIEQLKSDNFFRVIVSLGLPISSNNITHLSLTFSE